VALALFGAACGGDDGDGAASSPSASQTESAAVTHPFVALDAGGPLTKEALAEGDIDVAVLFTSSAEEATYGWVHLADDRGLQPVENIIPAVRSDVLDDRIGNALDAVSAVLTTESIQPIVALVGGGVNPKEVAADFLEEAGIPAAKDPAVGGMFPLTVGSASFPESEVVAELYTQALRGAGIEAEHTPDLGFREVYLPALEDGDVDVVPEFVGSLLTHLGGEPNSDLDQSLDALTTAAAERNIALLAPAQAQSQNGFYVRAVDAETLGLATISDLTTIDRPLIFGGPAECPDRPLCLAGLREVYGLEFDV
jgi:osmoprotectant transport system substrate-binding protein